MNMYYVRVNLPAKIKPLPRTSKRGFPPHLKKRKTQSKNEMLDWVCSWNVWIPFKILCS